MTHLPYLLLLTAVALQRAIELRVSVRNRKRLTLDGSRRVADPAFKGMVALHAGVLVAAGAEVIALDRPVWPALTIAMVCLLVATNVVRWWAIRALGGRWTVRVMTPSGRGIVTNGPFRFVRHPNYAAVFLEMVAVPLVHTAWVTAIAGTLLHVWALRRRVRLEESVLFADADYRAAMTAKPRFVPRFSRTE